MNLPRVWHQTLRSVSNPVVRPIEYDSMIEFVARTYSWMDFRATLCALSGLDDKAEDWLDKNKAKQRKHMCGAEIGATPWLHGNPR